MTELERATKARDAYLEQHPELYQYQRDLEIALSGITDPNERLQAILAKLQRHLEKLKEAISDLHRQ